MFDKEKIGENSKICIRWDTIPSNYSREQEKSIISYTANKYGVSEFNVRVEVNFVNNNNDSNIALNTENIHSIQDPKFQQELFKEYIKENNIENYDFDELIKIDSRINSVIDYNVYDKGKRYSIKWVKWGNFLSFGDDNYFDFTKLHGIVQLCGMPANESGKSTFAYDLLHFLLFGKTSTDKAKTISNLFNNYRPDVNEVNLEGCINIEGHDYIIKRKITRSAKTKKVGSQVIEYYIINEGGFKEKLEDENNLQGASSTKTNKIIKEALGNESDFDLIISANAKDLDSLISLKDTERGRLLSRWIGLSVLEDKDVKAREIWNKEVYKNRVSSLYNREQLAQDNEMLQNTNRQEESFMQSEQNKIASIDEDLKNLTNDINALVASKRAIDNNLPKEDITTLEMKKKEVLERGKTMSEIIKTDKDKLSQYGDITVDEDNYKALVNKKENLAVEIYGIKQTINNLKEENNKLLNSEYCPTCHRKLDGVDNSAFIEKNKATIEDLIKNGVTKNTEKEQVTKEVEKIEANRKLLHEKNKLELTIAANENKLVTYRSEYTETNNQIKALQANMEAIKLNQDIDVRINAINVTMYNKQRVRNDALTNVVSSQKNIEKNNDKIKNNNSFIAKIEQEEKEERNWKLYLQLIGKDGISKIVLRNSLPIINSELSRLLDGAADFDVEVSINDKNDVEFTLIRDGVRTMLSAASGLERTQASLALRVVLGKMSNLSRPPFLLLDEILGTVAKENYDKMKLLYDKIAKEYDFVLHITHLDLPEWHNDVVLVQKEDNISKIIYNK